MSAQVIEAATGQVRAQTRAAGNLAGYPIAAATAVIAICIQSLWIPIDADVSWLITVSERLLSGDRLYVDIVEVNPPASVWLYLPLVWLAKLIGTRPEAVVAAAFVAAGLLSVAATVKVASRLDDCPRPLWLTAAVGFVALVLPMGLFAQREHAALLLALPSLAALAVISEGKNLRERTNIAGGFACGLLVVVKPYFAIAVAAPALWTVWKRRSLSPLLPGIAAGVAAVLGYAFAILFFAKPYFDWLPVLVHTYGPMHSEPWKILVGPALFPAMFLALGLLLRPPRIPPLAIVWALGSAGFVLAAIAQAKNYPNHWLPGGGLAIAATFTLLAQPDGRVLRRSAVAAWFGIISLCAMYNWAIRPDPAVAAAIRGLAPPTPKIIALSSQLTTGHPVTRNVDGQWVGSRASLFTAAGARFVGLGSAIAARVYRDDIRSFAVDVEHHKPDVILVLVKSKAWLMREPEIAQAMEGYQRAASAGETEVWLRRAGG